MKLLILGLFFCVYLIGNLTNIALAADSRCSTTLNKITQPASSRNLELDAQFANLAKKWQQGWTQRGFLGVLDGTPELTAETYKYAMKNGLMWWNLRIVFVKDLEDAGIHYSKIDNILVKPVYVVGTDAEVKFKNHHEGAARIPVEGISLKSILEKSDGFYDFDENEKPVHVPFKSVQERLSFNTVSRVAKDAYSVDRPFYIHDGWAATKIRGVIEYAAWEKSDSIAKGRKLARALSRAGFRIVVNGDFNKSLDMARDQLRMGVAQSRYQSEVLYNAALEMYKEGYAFSVELYNEKGELVGGSINFQIGELVIGDTVFYKEGVSYKDDKGSTKNLDPIEASFVVDIVTLDYMNALGVSMMDVGMVSHYSETLKGRIISRAEFLEKTSKLSKNNIAFPKVLDPHQYPDLDFTELSKSPDSKAITKARFVGGVVNHTEFAIQKAKSVGLKPLDLKIFAVTSQEEIKKFSAVENALFYVGHAEESARATVEKLVNEGAKYVLDSADSRTKLIKPEQLKNVINPRLNADMLYWNDDPVLGRHLILKGWALDK